MRRSLTFGILLLAALSLAVTTSAGKPAAPKPTNIPVTVTITDGTGYAIQSDGDGAYVNGVNGVTAVIVPLGNLQLKTGIQRAFSLDFGDCFQACDPEPPTGSRQGYMTTSCPTSLLNMVADPDAYQECNLTVHFTANGLGWFIRFGEDPVTDPAMVTRLDQDNWTIDVPAGSIALLQSYPLKGRLTYTSHGYFHMPANLTVAR